MRSFSSLQKMPHTSNTIIVWFRNDLRIRDHEALYHACKEADYILPIYCIDPRLFQKTNHFKLPKTGTFRAKFLLESVRDLQFALRDLHGELIIRSGKPEEVVFALAKYHHVKAVYCHQEATDEEIAIEDQLERNLKSIGIPMRFFWGSTLFHYDDLPFAIEELPDAFTEFRKEMERKKKVRPTFPIPKGFKVLPNVASGTLPTLKNLGLESPKKDKRAVLPFKGGETQAWLRLKYYFWESKQLSIYKETRNGLLDGDYSSKFSPWLANGCISPRSIFEELQRYEAEIEKNKSTYWLFFELAWRDYFRFVAMKYESDIFKIGGLKRLNLKGKQNLNLFEKWCKGQTGIPWVDANMRELTATGFMSNRGRQNVASFLVKDLGLDWRMGAEYFESLLIDYDPCSNYGNWNYVAGIGRDPRPNRYFNILIQAKHYEPNGEYVKYWCPELKSLPSTYIHQPSKMNEAEQKYVGVRLGKDYPRTIV